MCQWIRSALVQAMAWRQAITWTNADILSIGPLETSFSEIRIKIQNFSFTKMHLKISSGKWRPFCFSLNVLSSTLWYTALVTLWMPTTYITSPSMFPQMSQYFNRHMVDFIVSSRRCPSTSTDTWLISLLVPTDVPALQHPHGWLHC